MNKTKTTKTRREFIVMSMLVLTFLLVVTMSISVISNMRINNGDLRSDKDLICYFTLDQTTNANITWHKNGVQNLTASLSCTNGVECFTSLGSGTVPSSYTIKGDVWNCTVAYYNGSAVETSMVSATIEDTAPSQPRIFYSNGSEIINITINVSEDIGVTLTVNATDEDGDSITYSINDTTFCSIGGVSGILTCSPTDETHLGIRNIRISAQADLSSTGKILTMNITPTNDAPSFSPSLSATNLTENQVFNYYVNGLDAENNIPLNLVIRNVTPYLNLSITRINDTAFVIMMDGNRTVTFQEASTNYNITLVLNDTDNITSNTRNVTSSFIATGITFNHLPNISYAFFNVSTMTQGGSFSLYINASDIDNDTITFSTNSPLYPISSSSSTQYGVVPNASFAYAWINITTLNNTHVANTNFTLYVFDTNENNTQAISFFITNVNDVPLIYQQSNYSSNSYNMTNLSELVAYTGVLFNFRINATDIDDLTYDAASTGLGTYSTNSSVFAINSTSGILRFTPNATGEHLFIVTVTDDGGLTYNYTANITILANTNPAFTVDPITIYCFEFDSVNYNNRCYYNISNNVSESDIGDYVASFYTNSTFFNITTTGGIINFSANQSDVGNNSILFNVTDTRGGMNSTIIYVIINNTNNPPNMSTPNVPSGNMIVGIPYQIVYTASDRDLSLSNTYENLTFSSVINGPNTTIFNLSKISATQATLAITPIGEPYEGNYSINVTVTDYHGNTSSYYLSIYIYNATAPPSINTIKPFGTPLNNTVNDSFVSTTNFPTMNTTIRIYENTTYVFNQTSLADNSSYSNSLTYAWYYDGTNVASTIGYNKTFNFFSNGTHNLTFAASDQYGSNATFTWIIEVANVNRPPTYNTDSLENLTIGGSGFIPNYLTYSSSTVRFYDPDDDPSNLGYSSDNTTTLDFSSTTCAFATFSFEQNRLNVVASAPGECYVIFSAADALNSSMNVSSEIVLINITNVSESGTTVVTVTRNSGGSSSTPISIPLPQEVEKPRPLQLVTPKLVTTYRNSTIEIPVILNNTWNDTLLGITLEAEVNSTNVSIYMDDIYIPKLEKGEVFETSLYVRNYKSEGHYEIHVAANVSIPAYRDVATIYINSAERNSEGEELENKISFAQDLLSSNPECQELNELLQQAKLELASENYAVTAKIVDSVLNGCKFLVQNAQQKETPEREFIKTFEWRRSYNDYLILGLFGILFAVTLYYILKKDNSEQSF
ncbi:MAG TPA: hypothetical protein VEC16_02680 [Alphaproteobacteria bacterium]|nr:hypothetical protein [Alphaproteobacteria bacterium]